ncbi:RsmB/NOP family class I SAM-dependent RNA methyltransferase [Sphingopyxis alaskensis]|jgi:16S rRNA (cytosine967-C5)-methyltransferase|uniref:Fmu (Sun) n=1 Tax=Sphingopyxis alaskensis (strain DSM 13593 / LMG 18877 / RB2256) TaxID=317655 RepID=Q1GUC7_SPHAL|nr:RsmB/NOP family class I SAM-dependent RNA methyltransferase [Sphingopyxis alaskensis]ABF52745.1 Fmu (Sun) [Sphingopyxis alaskensis RB2256]MCM3418280.1 RsmB/NOP family class I SAM-dependent RNA methyltransferase [Sphingopyxis alaskensis]
MTPAARIQTAIEILDAIAAAAREGGAPADAILAEAMRARRYAGSKDRRAIRALVYDVIRAVRSAPESGRAAMLALADAQPGLAALFDGSAYGPAPIAADEPRAQTGVAAEALIDLFDPLVGEEEHDSLLARAPLDLRVNRIKAGRADLETLFPEGAPIPGAPDGWRLPPETAAAQHPAYAEGAFEVQDAASQYASAALAAAPGQAIVDLCAGGGGKTLAIASLTGNAADILACDTNRARLQQLPRRAERAGATRIATRLLNPGQEVAMLADWQGRADRVFVDAPCSGSGTWRRSPELRWRLTPARLDRHLGDQAKLIDLGADLVAPGGKLLYAVCSIIAREGRAQVADFLNRHPGWTADADYLPGGVGRAAGAGFLLTPAHDGCDGFFLARLTSPC